MCPEIFFQLFTVHAVVTERILSCVYALLSNKRQETYGTFYRELQRVIEGRPIDIVMDFELAFMNAVAANLQSFDIKGCFYHLSSNIREHIQREGLQQRYNMELEFANTPRMIAFVFPKTELFKNSYREDLKSLFACFLYLVFISIYGLSHAS